MNLYFLGLEENNLLRCQLGILLEKTLEMECFHTRFSAWTPFSNKSLNRQVSYILLNKTSLICKVNFAVTY